MDKKELDILKIRIINALTQEDNSGSTLDGIWKDDIDAIKSCDDVEGILDILINGIGFHKDEAQHYITNLTPHE